MAGNGERLDDRSAVLPAQQPDDPARPGSLAGRSGGPSSPPTCSPWPPLATVGWIDALDGGVRESDPTRTLWVMLLIVILVEVALLNKATHGQFSLRLQQPDERQRAAWDRGYRYGFRILTGAVTAVLAMALYLPGDRLLGATNQLAWLAVAIVGVYLMWMLPTPVVAWMEQDPARRG